MARWLFEIADGKSRIDNVRFARDRLCHRSPFWFETPEDIAGDGMALLVDNAGWVTGQIIDESGGLSI